MVDLLFLNPTFISPTLAEIRSYWTRIPQDDVREMIAVEHQQLYLLGHLLAHLHFTQSGQANNPPYTQQLNLSLRAGMVKSTVLIAASIVEAALRSHAEARGYKLHKKEFKRTFGNTINAWEKCGQGIPRELSDIWDTIKALKEFRNNIHLFKAAGDETARFQHVLSIEQKLHENSESAINCLMNFSS